MQSRKRRIDSTSGHSSTVINPSNGKKNVASGGLVEYHLPLPEDNAVDRDHGLWPLGDLWFPFFREGQR